MEGRWRGCDILHVCWGPALLPLPSTASAPSNRCPEPWAGQGRSRGWQRGQVRGHVTSQSLFLAVWGWHEPGQAEGPCADTDASCSHRAPPCTISPCGACLEPREQDPPGWQWSRGAIRGCPQDRGPPARGLTLVQELVEEQRAGEEEEVGQHLGRDLRVHLQPPQELQGRLVDGHDAAQLLGQLGGRAPALPALRLERGALQQGREADVQGLRAGGECRRRGPGLRLLPRPDHACWDAGGERGRAPSKSRRGCGGSVGPWPRRREAPEGLGLSSCLIRGFSRTGGQGGEPSRGPQAAQP